MKRVTYEEHEEVIKFMNTKVPRQQKSAWIRENNKRAMVEAKKKKQV